MSVKALGVDIAGD